MNKRHENEILQQKNCMTTYKREKKLVRKLCPVAVVKIKIIMAWMKRSIVRN